MLGTVPHLNINQIFESGEFRAENPPLPENPPLLKRSRQPRSGRFRGFRAAGRGFRAAGHPGGVFGLPDSEVFGLPNGVFGFHSEVFGLPNGVFGFPDSEVFGFPRGFRTPGPGFSGSKTSRAEGAPEKKWGFRGSEKAKNARRRRAPEKNPAIRQPENPARMSGSPKPPPFLRAKSWRRGGFRLETPLIDLYRSVPGLHKPYNAIGRRHEAPVRGLDDHIPQKI